MLSVQNETASRPGFLKAGRQRLPAVSALRHRTYPSRSPAACTSIDIYRTLENTAADARVYGVRLYHTSGDSGCPRATVVTTMNITPAKHLREAAPPSSRLRNLKRMHDLQQQLFQRSITKEPQRRLSGQ